VRSVLEVWMGPMSALGLSVPGGMMNMLRTLSMDVNRL